MIEDENLQVVVDLVHCIIVDVACFRELRGMWKKRKREKPRSITPNLDMNDIGRVVGRAITQGKDLKTSEEGHGYLC